MCEELTALLLRARRRGIGTGGEVPRLGNSLGGIVVGFLSPPQIHHRGRLTSPLQLTSKYHPTSCLDVLSITA